MASSYTYITTPAYIKQLTFDYIETYSFQRGTAFEAYSTEIRKEYFALQARKAKHGLKAEQEERYLSLTDLNTKQYLIGADGTFHPSSKKTHTFKRTDDKIAQLTKILSIDAVTVPAWMCAPIYRDAIVFYDNCDQVISVLNVCFSCQYMSTKPFTEINADVNVYILLKKFFVELGHVVEEP